jgi:hypothetical protein
MKSVSVIIARESEGRVVQGNGNAAPPPFPGIFRWGFSAHSANESLECELKWGQPPRSLTAKPNSRKRFYDKESKQFEAAA